MLILAHFGKELDLYGKDVYILARKDGPRRGKIMINPMPELPGSCLAKNIASPMRLSMTWTS